MCMKLRKQIFKFYFYPARSKASCLPGAPERERGANVFSLRRCQTFLATPKWGESLKYLLNSISLCEIPQIRLSFFLKHPDTLLEFGETSALWYHSLQFTRKLVPFIAEKHFLLSWEVFAFLLLSTRPNQRKILLGDICEIGTEELCENSKFIHNSSAFAAWNNFLWWKCKYLR